MTEACRGISSISFKIVFGYVNVHCDDYFEFHCQSATRGHSFKLRKRHCSVNSRSNFFTERIVNLWNALPPDIVNFDSLSSFKRSIELIFLVLLFKRRLTEFNFYRFLRYT